MVDTLYADVSEFQDDVDDRYALPFLAFRSNDGSYRDHHFASNLKWSKAKTDVGRLVGFMVYAVWERDWLATTQTCQAMIGVPHRQMAIMIDVERWGSRYSLDQSAGINAMREMLIAWLGKSMSRLDRLRKLHRKRVVVYGNAYDLALMYPQAKRGDAKIVLANYSANLPFPNKLAHQFSDKYPVPPFGPCDINSADGLSPKQFAAALGLVPASAPVVRPKPKPKATYYVVRAGDTLGQIAARHGTTWAKLQKLNKIKNANRIYVGQHLRVR